MGIQKGYVFWLGTPTLMNRYRKSMSCAHVHYFFSHMFGASVIDKIQINLRR